MIKRDLWEIGLKRDSSAGGKFATPPIRKVQSLGAGALLGLVAIAIGILIRRRRGGVG